MISYEWDSQLRAIKLREKLKDQGYNVWMDVEQMGKVGLCFVSHDLMRVVVQSDQPCMFLYRRSWFF